MNQTEYINKAKFCMEFVEEKENNEFQKELQIAIANSISSLEKDLVRQEKTTLSDSFMELAIKNVARRRSEIQQKEQMNKERLTRDCNEPIDIQKEEDEMIEWENINIQQEEQDEKESDKFEEDWKQTPELWGNYNDFVEVE